MNATEIVLTISLLLNVAFVLGAPIALFVRFLVRRVRWRIIGQGANGVDFREGRPKNGFYIWKAGGANIGLIKIDASLVDTATDGRQVLWVDTDNMHQITPQKLTAEQHAKMPEAWRKALEDNPTASFVLQAQPGFGGVAMNDREATKVTSPVTGKEKTISYLVWQRISGWRLYKAYRDTRVAQLNDPQAGLAALMQAAMPVLMIFALGLLVVLVIMGA